jgi:hypothetical protein
MLIDRHDFKFLKASGFFQTVQIATHKTAQISVSQDVWHASLLQCLAETAILPASYLSPLPALG